MEPVGAPVSGRGIRQIVFRRSRGERMRRGELQD